MCGIWGIFGVNKDVHNYIQNFFEIKHRGLDCFRFENLKRYSNIALGFHRLAFQDPTNGMQPLNVLHIPHVVMIYNGEIYNFQELIQKHNFKTQTGSDGEVLVHLYDKGGIDFMVENLYGVYGFILLDTKLNKLYIGRDTFGVRPLYRTYSNKNNVLGVCSEAKGLCKLEFDGTITPVMPGTYEEYNLVAQESDAMKKSCELVRIKQYHTIGDYPKYDMSLTLTADIYENIRTTFRNAVAKRIFGEKKVGCLLSGGLGSSLVCAILAQELEKVDGTQLTSFAIGMGKNSTDIVNARAVAKKLNTQHHEIIFTAEEAIDSIHQVIRITETYDKSTVRDAVLMNLLAKFVARRSDVRCVFTGDGNDEVTQGYVHFYDAPTPEASHKESMRLLNELHLFDILRADHTTAYNGLELRLPYMDHYFVAYYLSLPAEMRQPKKGERLEKHLLRKAFENEDLLPHDVIWSPKLEMADGAAHDTDVCEVLADHANRVISDEEMKTAKELYPHAAPTSKEAFLYRQIFEKYYPGSAATFVPHKWCEIKNAFNKMTI